MANTEDVRDLLIAAGVDPDTEVADLESLNAATVDPTTAPELYVARGRSWRDESPISPVYDQDRTPWSESDRNLIF